MTPEQVRNEISERLILVKSELGINAELELRYQKWLDNDAFMAEFFTKFIHGDLYAGHTLTHHNGEVCGIIDWSTAQVSDIAQDFSGHVTVFGEESLKNLISAYENKVEKYGINCLNKKLNELCRTSSLWIFCFRNTR